MPGVAAAGSGCGGCRGRGQHRRTSLRDPLNRFISSNWPLQRVRSALVERAQIPIPALPLLRRTSQGGCRGRGQHRRTSLRDPLNRFISSNWPLQRVRSALVERAQIPIPALPLRRRAATDISNGGSIAHPDLRLCPQKPLNGVPAAVWRSGAERTTAFVQLSQIDSPLHNLIDDADA